MESDIDICCKYQVLMLRIAELFHHFSFSTIVAEINLKQRNKQKYTNAEVIYMLGFNYKYTRGCVVKGI